MSSTNPSVPEETLSTGTNVSSSQNPQSYNSSYDDDTTMNRRLNGITAVAIIPTSNRSYHQPNVLAWPWIIFFLFLYVFVLFWINYAIVQRYWILHNWNDALPGLDKTSLRKFTMRSHMTAGAVALLLGPIQLLKLRRQPASPASGCPNLLLPLLRCCRIHRWSGRIYCTCAILSCIFGLWFIALKKRLVGGYNMTASFALAGCAMGYTSFRAWQTARVARYSVITTSTNTSSTSSSTNNNNNDSSKTSWRLVQQHRNWGIRSLAQILAPALYRYWYTMMQLFHMYRVPVPLRMGGHCDANDLCPDYMRRWDSIYTWLYWISAGLVAEIIIYFLPSYAAVNSSNVEMGNGVMQDERGRSGGEQQETSLSAPLLSRSPEEHDQSNNGCTGCNNTTTNYGSDNRPRSATSLSSIMPAGVEDDNYDHSKGMPFVVNLVGGLLACAAVAITGATLYTVVKQSSTDS
jgi:hypothetical protein